MPEYRSFAPINLAPAPWDKPSDKKKNDSLDTQIIALLQENRQFMLNHTIARHLRRTPTATQKALVRLVDQGVLKATKPNNSRSALYALADQDGEKNDQ